MVVRARQSLELKGFFEIVEVCLNLGGEFCITWLVLSNYKKLVRNHQL